MESYNELKNEPISKVLSTPRMNSGLISVKRSDSLDVALKVLSENDISSCPVIDPRLGCIGLVDMFDIEITSGKSSKMVGMNYFNLNLDPVSVMALVELYSIGCRRIPIYSPPQAGGGVPNLNRIISQTDLAVWAWSSLPIRDRIIASNHTVETLYQPSPKCVNESTPTIEVLKLLHDNKISAVAVVNDKGKFKNEISTDSWKGMNEKNMDLLFEDVKSFLKSKSKMDNKKAVQPPTCSLDTPIQDIWQMVHRNLKQEVDKYLVDSIQYRRELKILLNKYSKSPSDSQNDKISNVMAKLNLSIALYEKYLTLLESELKEFCGNRHKYLLSLSKNVLNLHHLVHFGRKMADPVAGLTASQSSPDTFAKYSAKVVTPIDLATNGDSKPPPTTFNEIIENPVFLKAFRIYAEKHHGLENLLFWMDAQTLRELETDPYTQTDTVRTLFLQMYNNYVVPGASFEVNIDSDSRNCLDQRRFSLFTDEEFYPSMITAVESIFSILSFSMVPLFLKSPLYQASLMMYKGGSQLTPEMIGVSHLLTSLEVLINSPIGLEYLLIYLRPWGGSQVASPSTYSPSSSSPPLSIGSSSSTSTSPTSSGTSSPAFPSLSPRALPLLPSLASTISHAEARHMIFFLLESRKFCEISDEFLDSYATELYEQYLRSGAEKELHSLVSSYQPLIHDALVGKRVTRTLYQPISQDIMLQLTNNFFPAFLQSQVCRDMLNREEKMIKYLEKDKKKPESKVDLQFEQISREKLKTIFPKSARGTSIKPGTSMPSIQNEKKPLPALPPNREDSSNKLFSPNTSATRKPTAISSADTHPIIVLPIPPTPVQRTSSPSMPPSPASSDRANPNEVFCYVLSDATWLDAFKRFVRSEKCEELLLCWMELERYSRASKTSISTANNIYENFFQDGSPLEVNLDQEVKNVVRDAILRGNIDEVDLELRLACQSAFELLRVDSFSRFIKSPIYKELAGQLGDPFDSRNRPYSISTTNKKGGIIGGATSSKRS
eukprot:gene3614-4142_t